jgi:hypothetical protein
MFHEARRILACLLFALVGAPAVALAQALSVDWKVYGAASVDGREACFYDAKGVVHGTDGHIRVWTKCLSIKDMENRNNEKDFGDKILGSTANKLEQHYVPPYATVETIDENKLMVIIAWEETANTGDISPHSQLFEELNCSEKMLRTLSIHLHVNGTSGSRDKPGDWQYVVPETNAARLIKILCPMR